MEALRSTLEHKKYSYIIASMLSAFVVIGGYLVKDLHSVEALSWMAIYNSTDFANANLSEIIVFFKNLRIPVPPVIGLGEILSTKLFGSPALITTYAYRISLVGGYCLAIVMAGTTYKRMICSFCVSMLFLYCTTIIHPQNPQGYDVFCPLFFLTYVLLLKYGSSDNHLIGYKCKTIILPVAAGFFLAMTELTRPYVIYLMPLLVLSAYWSFAKDIRKKQFMAFIFPVLLLSGGWHGYQYIAHQQISFSNHAGFNLDRAWREVYQAGIVEEKNDAPLGEGRGKNLNTAEHSYNSKLAQSNIIEYWIEYPYESSLKAIGKIANLLSAHTSMYDIGGTESALFGLYKLVAPATGYLVLFCTGILFLQGIRKVTGVPDMLSNQDNMILLFAAATIVIEAIGESGEEARYLIAVLPFLATLPIARSHGNSADQPGSVRW